MVLRVVAAATAVVMAAGCGAAGPTATRRAVSSPPVPAVSAPPVPASAPAPPAPTPPPAVPRRGGGAPALVPGRNCAAVAPYRWVVDPQRHVATLPAGHFEVRLPPRWQVRQERPELLVLLAPGRAGVARGVFELIVSPHCDRYYGDAVRRRVAARSLAHRFSAEQVGRAFDSKTSWRARLATGAVTFDDDLEIGRARVPLALFFTPLGSSETHEVTLAAACPRASTPGSACEAAYRVLTRP